MSGYPGNAYFYVDLDSILHPLGLLVTGDSRYELLPSTRDNTEEIPGVHGEIDFGSELKARPLELHVVTEEGLSPIEKKQLQRLISMHLDPTKGVKSLVFADEPEKMYMVKYSGKIPLTNQATWFQFVIPFKMNDPFIIGTSEKNHSGAGTLVNEGTRETGLVIELKGPLVNPQIVINGEILYYDGEVPAGYTLIINTEKKTAIMGNLNVIDRFNEVFPFIYPGNNPVSASSNITFKWRDKWI